MPFPAFLRRVSTAAAVLALAALLFTACPSPVSPGPGTVAVDAVSLDKTTLGLELSAAETPGTSPEPVTASLVATVSPANASDGSVTWASDKDSVATVTGGVVTAVAPGTATITAASVDGHKTASCVVTVSGKAATGLSMDKTSAMVAVRGSLTLAATLVPAGAWDRAITWTTSDSAKATVADGVVTGVDTGLVTITAASADGTQTASCKVEVYPSAPLLADLVGTWKRSYMTMDKPGYQMVIASDGGFNESYYESGTSQYIGYRGTVTVDATTITLNFTTSRSSATAFTDPDSGWAPMAEPFSARFPCLSYLGKIRTSVLSSSSHDGLTGVFVHEYSRTYRDRVDNIRLVMTFKADGAMIQDMYYGTNGTYPDTPNSTHASTFVDNHDGTLTQTSGGTTGVGYYALTGPYFLYGGATSLDGQNTWIRQ